MWVKAEVPQNIPKPLGFTSGIDDVEPSRLGCETDGEPAADPSFSGEDGGHLCALPEQPLLHRHTAKCGMGRLGAEGSDRQNLATQGFQVGSCTQW